MQQYRNGMLVATEILPRKNNMHYEQYRNNIYGIYSYDTLIGYYDAPNNVIIEWAKTMHYSPTTSKQATTLSNYMKHKYYTNRISVDVKEGIVTLYKKITQ